MIFKFDWNRGLFVARSRGPKKRSAEAVNRTNLTFAVSPKYLSNETKIYTFITRIPRGVYIIFWGFFKNFNFPTSSRYLQTSALKYFAWIAQPYVNGTWSEVNELFCFYKKIHPVRVQRGKITSEVHTKKVRSRTKNNTQQVGRLRARQRNECS